VAGGDGLTGVARGAGPTALVRPRGDGAAPSIMPTAGSPPPAAAGTETRGARRNGDGLATGIAPVDTGAVTRPDDHVLRTPSGLPWRVRQANLPKQLWDDDALADEPPARDPEQVRRAMHSYQIGTQRGRGDGGESDPAPGQVNHQPPGAESGDREEG
jgi:hypothetical protein